MQRDQKYWRERKISQWTSLLQISLRRQSLQRPLVKLQYKVEERLLQLKKESRQRLRQRNQERHQHQPVSRRQEHQISSQKQRLSQSRSVS